MRTQFTSFFTRSTNRIGIVLVAAAGLTLSAVPARAAISPSDTALTSETTNPPNWLDQLIEWLEELYSLMGGDPSALDGGPGVEARISMVLTYYTTHGMPHDLTPAEQSEVIADIQQLHAATFSSEGGISIVARLTLRLALEKIWVDLGLPLSEL